MEKENENSDAFDQWKNQFTKPGQKEELNQFEDQLKEAWQQNSENGSECILKSAKLSVIVITFFLSFF